MAHPRGKGASELIIGSTQPAVGRQPSDKRGVWKSACPWGPRRRLGRPVGSRRDIRIEWSSVEAYAKAMLGGDRPVTWTARIRGTSNGNEDNTNRIDSTAGRTTRAASVWEETAFCTQTQVVSKCSSVGPCECPSLGWIRQRIRNALTSTYRLAAPATSSLRRLERRVPRFTVCMGIEKISQFGSRAASAAVTESR